MCHRVSVRRLSFAHFKGLPDSIRSLRLDDDQAIYCYDPTMNMSLCVVGRSRKLAARLYIAHLMELIWRNNISHVILLVPENLPLATLLPGRTCLFRLWSFDLGFVLN